MKLDLKKALGVPFSEDDWAVKLGVAALIFLPGLISDLNIGEKSWITSGLYLVATFIITGYAIVAAHFEVRNSQISLPDWDVGDCIIQSLKLWVVSTAWILMFIPIIIILGLLSAIAPGLIIAVILLGIPFVITFALVLNIAESFFLDELILKDAFDFRRIFHFLKTHYGKYLLYIFLLIAVVILYGIITGVVAGITAMILNKAVANYVANVISILVLLTTMNMLAQTYKAARDDDNFLVPEDTSSII